MKKSYWQSMYVGDERSQNACKSWFAPLGDDLTPYKAEVLCDVETDREKKVRAFMTAADGSKFKLERTIGREFSLRRVALAR